MVVDGVGAQPHRSEIGDMMADYQKVVDTFIKVSTTDPIAYHRDMCARAADNCVDLAPEGDETEYWKRVAANFRDPNCDAPTQVASEGGR